MSLIADAAGVVAVVGAAGWVARGVANMPRTPAPVRRGAAATANAIRHPVKSARSSSPRAAQSAEGIWAKARAENWLKKQDAKRAAKASQPPRQPRRFLPRVAVNLPGVTGPAPGKPSAPAAPAAPQARPATPAPAAVAVAVRPSTAPVRPTINGRPVPMPGRYSAPPDHAAVIHRVAQFEPDSDGELIQFMAAEAAAHAGYAEALEHLSEHLVNSVGLDPASVQGVHEFGEAISDAGAVMARAVAKFQAVYQGVRETVAAGTVLPHDGRFMTGEDA